jgi:hypothetical protein
MHQNLTKKTRFLIVFYKSTLTISLSVATLCAAFGLFISPRVLMTLFAIGLMTGGTALSILYKEITSKHEYYFYFNVSISKITLLLSCVIINGFIGVLVIWASIYIK